jgi:nicotinamide-nucleotide amidase
MTGTTLDRRMRQAADAVAARLDGRTVAVAESCTAGRIASALAGVERAADFFRGGLTAYQEDVKRRLLDVEADTVLCERAACEMATGVAHLLDVGVAVATTGVAGDEPVDGVPPGTVFVATLVDGSTRTATIHVDADPDATCDEAAVRALSLLADHLSERTAAEAGERLG